MLFKKWNKNGLSAIMLNLADEKKLKPEANVRS